MRAILFALFAISRVCPASIASATQATSSPPALLGFSNKRTAEQHALEARFDAALDRDNLRTWMRRLAARPHHIGSAYGQENAEFMAALFRSWGYDTKIETFHVLFPTPRFRLLEMIAPETFTASLTEPPLAEDATSSQTSEQLPIYNCYSVDGDVTGELVYVC